MIPPLMPGPPDSPYGYQVRPKHSGIANGLAAAGALAAVAAFFVQPYVNIGIVLPYVNIGILGIYIGPQMATALQGGQGTASTLATLLWVQVALAAGAAGFALWEAIRHASTGAPISHTSRARRRRSR